MQAVRKSGDQEKAKQPDILIKPVRYEIISRVKPEVHILITLLGLCWIVGDV
jgi:hypothetical protein